MAPASPKKAVDAAEVLAQTQARIKTIAAAKEENATKGKALDEKLRRAFKTPPKRPNVTIDKIDEEMTRLEHRRNTTSMSLNDEKFILRELQLLKDKKVQVQEFEQFQQWVETTRTEREERFAQNKEYEKQLQELQGGLKKMSLAAKLQCNVADFSSIEITVPTERMGSVIGKGGAMATKIEEECSVLLEVEKQSNVVKITSTRANVQKAKEAIENITLATTHTIGLHPDTIKVLMAQKGKNLQELEQKLAIKIDINRVEGLLSTIAAPARVKQLEKALKELEEGKVEIQLPAEIVPKLIGKKGETINQLMEDTGCLVDIDKVTNAVRLCGTKESVGMAKKFIYELIEDQSQREREFSVHDTAVFPSPDYAAFKFGFFAEFLMSNKAQQLKLLRTDASDAKIKVLKEEQKIHVIGNKAQLKAMEEALRERLREFEAHHWLHEVSDNYVLSLIIGKKGAKIKQIEEEGKEAHVKVDIQGTHVCVFGDTPAGIEHARATILEVVEQNQRSVYHSSQHLISILLNNKRAKLSEIETNCGCKLNLPPPPGSGEAKGKTDTSDKQVKITLTGTLEAISDAKTQLEQLDEAHHVRYWPLDDDEVATVIGSKGATISDLESKSGAKLRVLRDGSNAELEMLGTQEQLTAVQKSLDELLQTKNRELLQLDPFATGCVIGKKGDRIKTIREAHPDASVDAFPNRGQVRIKAANPEALRACVEHVLKLLRETQVVESVKLPTGSTAGSFTAILEKYPAIAMRLQELEAEGGENMKVTYQEDGRVAKLRGPALGIGALKKFLEMLVDPESHFVETIKVPMYAFASVLLTKGSDGAIDANKLNENALRICKQTGCEIRVKKLTGTGRKDEQENPEGVIRIEGTNPAKVYEAKDQVEKVLQFYHSECIQTLDKLPQSVVPRLYELLPTLTAKHRVVFSLPNATTIKVFTDAKATTREVVAQLKKELEVWKKQHVEMPIPGWLVPVLVGKNGENIKKLGVESQNARLELSQSTGASGGKFAAQEERVLTISAREDAVIQLAVQNVKAFIQLHENRTSTVDVAKNKMDLVISAKKDAPSGVQVHIVHNAKNAETVQVVVYGGEHEDREALVEKIEHLISTSVIETITLPPNASNSVVGALIGKSGANIRALQKEFPRVMIDIKREANTISLKGPTDDVLQVKSVMEDKVQELLRQQEEYEQRTRQIEEEKRAQQQQHRAKPASVDGESDENAEPNQTKVSPPVVARTGPVGGSASMNQPKLNKNQRRRIRKRAENEKKSDVLSMIMGGESTTTTETETSVESSSHYHSSSGYSLRL